MATDIYDAKYWQARAAEIRAVANEMRDPISKQMMLQIAEDYQRLAERVERPTIPGSKAS